MPRILFLFLQLQTEKKKKKKNISKTQHKEVLEENNQSTRCIIKKNNSKTTNTPLTIRLKKNT